MTRVNVIPVENLPRQALVSEYREIVRVFALARSNQFKMHKVKQPSAYTLGTGHVLFFVDKLGYISKRYDSLCAEMLRRGYKCNRVPKDDLHAGIAKNMFWDYTPTPEAIAINKARIAERLGVVV